jgi:raffinose/stachyose/melibiose transport system permease protein
MSTKSERVLTYVVLILFSIVAVLPLVGVFRLALSPADGSSSAIDVGNFQRAWTTGQFADTLVSSTIIAVAVTVLTVSMSVLSGYAFAVLNVPGGSILFYVVLLGLIMPLEPLIIPLFYDLRRVGFDNTYWAIIGAEAALYFSFGTFWMRGCFRSMPRSLVDAARLDGASTLGVLLRVLLPAARPAVLALSVILFLWSWNEFLLPLVLAPTGGIQTGTIGLASFVGQRSTDLSGLAAGAVIVSVPVLVVYVLLQRRFMSGLLSGSGRV